MKYKFKDKIVAVELVNAGKCNMDCAYCYIPKSKGMNVLHDEVVAYLESGKFLDDTAELYGENLEHLSLWGTEPTLTIDIFTRWMPQILDRFPKLQGFNFSTNFMRDPKCLLDFVKAAPRDRDPFEIGIQYSIDGPAWITDVTRHPNATKRITGNVKKFMKELTKLDLGELHIHMNCKPTWNEDIIEMVGKDLALLTDYLEFFNEFFGEIDEILEGVPKSYISHAKINAPFLGLPGMYTQQHGIYWGEIYKTMLEEQQKHIEYGKYPHLSCDFTGYLPRYQRILDYGREFYTKPEMFTCSAGDSQYGLDHKGMLHSCHRTFYLNDDNYVKSVTDDCNNGNWDLEHYQNDRLGDIRKNMMVDIHDDDACSRFIYYNATHHHFIKNRINIYTGLIKILAKAGQINPIYYDDVVARTFAEYAATAYNCNVEYALTLGSMSLIPTGIIKVSCNGMFEHMVKAAVGGEHRYKDDWVKA
jgi:sulfatase maturation enzyme AslB (radical SAM superfamily)